MSTQVAEQHWSKQHENYGPGWCDLYWDSRGLVSRQAVLEQLRLLPEWRTLVELGCHSGPMLGVIAPAFPRASLTGVEVNPVAAEAARKNVPTANIITEGMCSWIEKQPDKSTDVLVTHYTLAYVSPVDLRAMLWHVMRVAKHCVLAEPMVLAERDAGLVHGFPEWRHAYGTVLEALGHEYRVIPCPPVGNLNAVLVVTG